MSTATAEPGAPTTGPAKAPSRRAARQRPPRKPRPTRAVRAGEPEEALSIVSSALTIVALVCAWMVLQMLVLGGLSQSRSQDLLYGEYREQLAAATAPTGAFDVDGLPVAPGAPVALLTIPTLGLSQVVVSGTSSGDLLAGPGHQRTTPLPGQAGISVVMGRATTYGAPFGDLASLQVGDEIQVQNAQGLVTYTVEDVRRAGDTVPQPLTGKQSRLILVTAEGSGPLSALRAQEALYVDAITTKAMPTGPLAGSALPASEAPMARDTSALPMLTLLLAGVALLVLAVSVARRRFRAVLVWLLAAPCVIALAWATTDQVMRLLPNLM